MAAGAQNLLEKPNVGGLGVGVRPMPEMAGQNYGLATAPELFRQQESIMAPSMPNVITQTGTELTRSNMGKTYGLEELEQLQEQYDAQEAIRQNKLNKLQELATMGDDTPQTSIRPQMVGTNPAARNINPLGHGPLDFGDDALKRRYFEGLYT